MSDWAKWKYGGTVLPLTSNTTNSFLKDADPPIYYALDYFQSVLGTYLSTRIAAQAALSPVVGQLSSAVATVCPFDPSPYLTEDQFKFPLLALYRTKETFEDKTIAHPHLIGEWTLQYVLPPLNAGQAERLIPLLGLVGKVLHNRIEQMFDPAYSSGIAVWTAAGVESIKLLSAQYGRWELGQGLNFPAWTAKLEVKELVSDVTGNLSRFTGVDLATDLASTMDTTLSDVADGQDSF